MCWKPKKIHLGTENYLGNIWFGKQNLSGRVGAAAGESSSRSKIWHRHRCLAAGIGI
jgi:hypothetical protein